MINIYLNSMKPAFILFTTFLALLITSSISLADSDYLEARKLYESGKILSLEEIIEKVKTHHPGRILEAELENKSGQLIYELEILGKDGIVKEIYVNAETAEIIKTEIDH